MIDDPEGFPENVDDPRGDEYKKFVDKIIKVNREIVVLSILSEKPMCGYDLIKEIFSKSDVFLSQGTVYPILYSLEEEGVLKAEFERGNMRTKVYFITPEGQEIVAKKLKAFADAFEFIMKLLNR